MKHDHGRRGHLNRTILDQDDAVTGYGVHARVVAFCPDHEGMYVRVDLGHGIRKDDPSYPILPEPTPAQIVKAAKRRQGPDLKGGWTMKTREVWPCGTSIDYVFVPRKIGGVA